MDPSDHDALRRWAARKGISTSAAVRLLARTDVCGKGRLSKDAVAGFRRAAGCIEGRPDDGDFSRFPAIETRGIEEEPRAG